MAGRTNPTSKEPWLRGCRRAGKLGLDVCGEGERVMALESREGLPPLTLDWGSCSRLCLCRHSLALSAAAPDLRHGVTLPGHGPLGMGSSRLLSLTSDVG